MQLLSDGNPALHSCDRGTWKSRYTWSNRSYSSSFVLHLGQNNPLSISDLMFIPLHSDFNSMNLANSSLRFSKPYNTQQSATGLRLHWHKCVSEFPDPEFPESSLDSGEKLLQMGLHMSIHTYISPKDLSCSHAFRSPGNFQKILPA